MPECYRPTAGRKPLPRRRAQYLGIAFDDQALRLGDTLNQKDQAVHACRQCPNAIDKLIGAIFKLSHPGFKRLRSASHRCGSSAASAARADTRLWNVRLVSLGLAAAAAAEPQPRDRLHEALARRAEANAAILKLERAPLVARSAQAEAQTRHDAATEAAEAANGCLARRSRWMAFSLSRQTDTYLSLSRQPIPIRLIGSGGGHLERDHHQSVDCDP